MGINPKALVFGVLGGIVVSVLSKKFLPRDRTDVDFRPLPQPGPDVIAGHETRPHVPGSGSTQDRVF
jgi:hypothetical protein